MGYYWTAIFLLLAASLSQAQDADLSERQMIQELTQRVNALQQKVQALESQAPGSGPSNTDTTCKSVSPPAPPDPDNDAQSPSLSQVLHELHGIQ